MHPFPVDPKQIRDPLEGKPEPSSTSRSDSTAMSMQRRTRNVGRALLALLVVALIVVVLIALL